jgi:tripeptidyl-peptidase-1
VILLSGGTNDQDPATAQIREADLDVQNIIGVSHPLPVTEFITGGSPQFIPNLDEPTAADNENEPYLPYYQYLLSQPNSALPQVISNSYGDDEQTVPKSYAIRVCNMIGMLGLRGISVLESAGDTGVGAPCKSNDGKNTTQFTPEFPGTCPYIISVGGTQAVTPEIAWVAGSGGFSNYFPRPAYQELAVSTYLSSHISPATKQYYEPYTNFAGRGFPDISAHSLTPE